MFGGLLALISAVTFAITNASVRRGVISGSAVQATTLSIPVGVPLFVLALGIGGGFGVFGQLPQSSVIAFAITGVTHFVIGRYANYRAIGAIGTNLAGPVTQFNLVVSLVFADPVPWRDADHSPAHRHPSHLCGTGGGVA